MKDSSGKSHCSVRTMPAPAFVTCLKCGHDVELWSDEEEAPCPACGGKVIRKEAVLH